VTTKNTELSINNETFCVYPWLHHQVTPQGHFNYCCIPMHTDIRDAEGGRPLNVLDDGLMTSWNSQEMQQIRQQMLSGKKVKGCQKCYFQEGIGKKSHRQMYNEEWMNKIGIENIKNIVDRSVENEFIVDQPPIYLDLRLGNLCNLKCRMCNPRNSTQIAKEWSELDTSSAGEYSRFWQPYGMDNQEIKEWFNQPEFWSQLDALIPNLRKVYMTGGEPSLIQGNQVFLQQCVSMGFAKNIELFFNLNMTRLSEEFVNLLPQFEWVGINASLDGHGIVNEYIRSPSKWSVIQENFERLSRLSGFNFELGISTVVQVYNILDLTDLFDFAEEISAQFGIIVHFDLMFCMNPLFLDVKILPSNIKLEAIRRLQSFASRSMIFRRGERRDQSLINGVQSLIKLLQEHQDFEEPDKINDFLVYTKTLDQKRRQSFRESLPELHLLLGDAGYDLDSKASITK
jgi:MoaA/NifB/PqqE/SkfB family radical SAM enzyme